MEIPAEINRRWTAALALCKAEIGNSRLKWRKAGSRLLFEGHSPARTLKARMALLRVASQSAGGKAFSNHAAQ
jgi:hypothetical protein